MAKVSPSPLIGVISGKMGGSVFRKGKDQLQIVQRLPTKITNPASLKQVVQRTGLAVLSKLYSSIGATNQGVWNTYAANKYGSRKQSQEGVLAIIRANSGRGTGKSLFIYCNQNYIRAGGIMPLTTPVPNALIPYLFFTSWTVTCATGTITISPNANAGTNDFLQAWIVGVNGKVIHRQVLSITKVPGVPPGMDTYTATGFQGARGAPCLFTAFIGMTCYVELEVIGKLTGLSSNPSDTKSVVLA